ncbi:bifunctional DNA primase/polymerase [Streptomyces albipurpureus]|uniref:Bifunctional DNA primase/polymerase n=1 Tax=Streptomyces albipurpureus TaxID=2897419 RepID=A0ABT0UWV4_9ACTN|nr:bifunctional DNA primase/polymerase [Streptomyces sp. CWNU-1]MCM2393067.1 bifunctional DNA primase/polymerase [Streptomyces sp. CWNU-1]
MTHDRTTALLSTALNLAQHGVPVLPLRAKRPPANCRSCRDMACGGRPHMRVPGPCGCPLPCHAWAAATTDTRVLTSAQWAADWRHADHIAYHPGGTGLTVVDLDNPTAVAWARETLPITRIVPTTRGEHWIYQGSMRSANAVRPGVDIKSLMAYARWLGPGTGTMTALPDTVLALVVKDMASPGRVGSVSAGARPVPVSTSAGGGECRHRTPAYLARGIAMAEQRITEASSGIHTAVYRTFLAVLSTHGRCGCLTEAHIDRLFAAAHAKGESPRHCSNAWANALTALGM